MLEARQYLADCRNPSSGTSLTAFAMTMNSSRLHTHSGRTGRRRCPGRGICSRQVCPGFHPSPNIPIWARSAGHGSKCRRRQRRRCLGSSPVTRTLPSDNIQTVPAARTHSGLFSSSPHRQNPRRSAEHEPRVHPLGVVHLAFPVFASQRFRPSIITVAADQGEKHDGRL